MAFQQGLSGLNSSSKAIQTVSNNIANSSTVGFKSANTQFADLYGSALTGSVGGRQPGIGGTVQAVKQSFTQGTMTATGNPLDLAINGNGFFRIQRNDGGVPNLVPAFTRNGQFDLDPDGFVVTALGDRLVGNVNGIAAPIQIPRALGAAVATTEITALRTNLDSRETPPIPAFDPTNIDSYNATTSLNVFDSQGNARVLTLYYIKNPVDNEWTVRASIDGDAPQLISDDLTFGLNGQFTSATVANVTRPSDGQVDAIDISLSLDKLTQFSSPFAVTELSQNGFAPGQLVGLSVTKGGMVQGRYTNGKIEDIALVELYTFASPTGLMSIGNNLWEATPDSGEALAGIPGTGLNGVISSGMVEDSNVDLTRELVSLIVQQRNYQANAQSIRTQDQLLQTLVNLR